MDPVEDLRFPIGLFSDPGQLDKAARTRALASIEAAPSQLRRAVDGLNGRQLDTRYRPEGWTVRQVVHHLPDSHLNSYIRFKLGLTEDEPTIRTYHEERWAQLPDSFSEIELSLALLENLHRRWTVLLRALSEPEWRRVIQHPDMGRMRLDALLAFYSWHGEHHIAHITRLRERNGW